MSRVNQAQMTKLLDLLSEGGALVRGRVSYVNTNKQNFWKRIALQLNSMDGGVYKNTWKWCKMWADWKNKTKKKADIFLRKKPNCYSEHAVTLTNLELRLLKLIEYPMEEKADILKTHMASKAEMPENIAEDIESDSLSESYNAQPNQNPISSEDEDNTELRLFAKAKSNFCNVNETLPDGDSKFQACGSSDSSQKVNIKDKKFKKKKNSLEEFKLKTTLALEKERVQQKSEELRLWALELQLKGDELRLKEIEMKKINYLTNIEDEKLKCFKDISSSLKELLDRTTNGSVRFHNVL